MAVDERAQLRFTRHQRIRFGGTGFAVFHSATKRFGIFRQQADLLDDRLAVRFRNAGIFFSALSSDPFILSAESAIFFSAASSS
jgi:hypothetical protein